MNFKHRIPRWCALFAALAFAGCEANHYEIQLRPVGETLQRELTCWRERAAHDKTEIVAFPEDELARIAAAYDAALPIEKARKHTFLSVFVGELPNDLGGSGAYAHWDTALGSVSAYVERFRGNDDLLADVENRQHAADRIADLLIGWLESELEGEAGFAELRDFLENRFRRDLKNLSLYGWAHGVVVDHEEAAQAECLVRVGQYLIERSYFTVDQLPALTRAWQATEHGEPARLLALVQRFTASKMGIAEDQPVPPGLRFLSDAAIAQASINEYLRQTDEFEQLLEEWGREKAANPDATELEPTAVVGDLLGRAFLPNIQIGRSDRLRVQVATATEPFLTNGKWDGEAKQVRWSRRVLAVGSDPSAFPTLLYALWSKPDGQAQKARFGRMVLEGRGLGDYCLWYRGLSKQEAKEWDEFVSSLQPGDGLTERLHTFRFSHEPPALEGDRPSSDLAATPRELILLGLADAATAPSGKRQGVNAKP